MDMSAGDPIPQHPAAGSLMSRGMLGTMAAQFLSGLADNALLFTTLALIRERGYPHWSGPLIQELFVGAYIGLAPFVGDLADRLPKGLVMVLANLVKCAGAVAMALDANPFLSYALVGVGAAANSPAKYGILGELAPPEQLVRANGLLEGATIAAIVLGAVAGGALADWSVAGSVIVIAVCYACSALAAMVIPRTSAAVAPAHFSFTRSLHAFLAQNLSLWRDHRARFAVIGTSIFWGAGAVLRFLVIAWVPIGLHVTNNRLPGFLTAMVAVGLTAGAATAARFIRLESMHRALPAGILIGLGTCLLPLVHTQPVAFCLMAFVGICSGIFVVPLDAALQDEGKKSVGAGAAIAIQNFFENFSMLLMVSGYTAITYLKVPVDGIAVGVGAFIALAMCSLILVRARSDA
jgi:LPLT family lysophospholipid transporter-like MFS transporter